MTTKKLTIMDVLGAASATNMNELHTGNLADLFKLAQNITPHDDKHFGSLKTKRCPKTAEEIKVFWTDLFVNREFNENHPINKVKNKFTQDPKILINGTKKANKTFNVLAEFGLGEKPKNSSSRTNSYVDKENLAIGSGAGTGTVTSDANDIIDKHSAHDTGEEQGPSKSNEQSADIAEQFQGVSDILQAQISQVIQSNIKSLSDKVTSIQTDAAKALNKANDASTAASAAKTQADNNRLSINKIDNTMKDNSTDISDAKKDIEENRTKLAGLTNDFHALRDGQVQVYNPETIDEFTLLRYYTLNKQARIEYRKAVNMAQTSGLMIMNVLEDHNATYILIDEENPINSVPNYKEIEDKLASDADGRIVNENRVKIKTAKAVKNKQNKWHISFQINAVNALRGSIVRRLIDERFTNAGHFGLKQNIPEQYNIDYFLGYVKSKFKSVTGHALIHSFDTNRYGFYVIYLNDYIENGYKVGTYHEGTTRLMKPKDFCSVIRPSCPREFAKLEKKYFNLEELFKLTKPKEYFCYNGHIYKVPAIEREDGGHA